MYKPINLVIFGLWEEAGLLGENPQGEHANYRIQLPVPGRERSSAPQCKEVRNKKKTEKQTPGKMNNSESLVKICHHMK